MSKTSSGFPEHVKNVQIHTIIVSKLRPQIDDSKWYNAYCASDRFTRWCFTNLHNKEISLRQKQQKQIGNLFSNPGKVRQSKAPHMSKLLWEYMDLQRLDEDRDNVAWDKLLSVGAYTQILMLSVLVLNVHLCKIFKCPFQSYTALGTCIVYCKSTFRRFLCLS